MASWRYTLEGTGDNIAIRRYKGYITTGAPLMLYQGFYNICHTISHPELTILLHMMDQMSNYNEIVMDNTFYSGLQLVMGYSEVPKPDDYRYPDEDMYNYIAKLKGRGNILAKCEGKRWMLNPKIAFKGSKKSRQHFMGLWTTFIDMRLQSPNITFNAQAMVKYVNEVNDIVNQNRVDGNKQNMIKRVNKANKEYKEKANITKILVPHYDRRKVQ